MQARSFTSVLHWMRGLALALTCAAGSANAAVYTGVWDPAYGPPFTNLGWRGTAQYTVPDSCELSGSGDVDNATACGGAAAVTSALVEFYDESATNQVTLATLVFNPSTMLVSTLRYLNGNLDQLVTTASNPVFPSVDLSAFGVSSTVAFSLQFGLTTGPRLDWTSCARPQVDCGSGTNSFDPQFSITRVPEPGSMWLSGLALAALFAAARRRSLRP